MLKFVWPALTIMTLTLAAAVAPAADCSKLFRAEPASHVAPETRALQEEFASLEQRTWWGSQQNFVVEYSRFVDARDAQRIAGRMRHAIESYGIETYHRWKRADAFLQAIPRGKLVITVDLILKVRQIAFGTAKAGFRTGPIIGAGPLRRPIADAHVKELRANPLLRGFFELKPFSRRNWRRGFILFGDARLVPARVQSVIDWFNQNRMSMDPIELAAGFQRQLVSIHPFVDGTGRTSRLLMDRILMEYGLPPPLLDNFDSDLYRSSADWVASVRKGIHTFNARAHRSLFSFPASVYSFTRNESLLRQKQLDPEIAAGMTDAFGAMDDRPFLEFTLGGQRFVFTADGFFYDRFGRPFAVHESRLYPLSEKAFWLYQAGGRFENAAAADSEAIFPRRMKSDEYQRLQDSGFKLMQALMRGDRHPESILVVPVSTELQEANRRGRIFLYPWQRGAFESALRIDISDPELALVPYRSDRTAYEGFVRQRLVTGRSQPLDARLVLAQYEHVDLQYAEYQETARNFFPDLEAEAIESRRQLHAAARSLLQKALAGYQRQLTNTRLELADLGLVRLFFAQLQRSKLSFASFDEGRVGLGDTHVTMLRSDVGVFRMTGFRTEDEWFNFLMLIPGSRTLVKAFTAIVERSETPDSNTPATADKNRGFIDQQLRALRAKFPMLLDTMDRIQWRVLESPYSLKLVTDEMDRALLTHTLHAVGDVSRRTSISMSTSTSLYDAFDDQRIRFVPPAFPGSVFLLSVPRDAVRWNWGTVAFSNEFEILSEQAIPRKQIVAEFSRRELALNTKSLSPAAAYVLETVFGVELSARSAEQHSLQSFLEQTDFANATIVDADVAFGKKVKSVGEPVHLGATIGKTTAGPQ